MPEALIGLGTAVVIQVLIFSYHYGKLSQQVSGLSVKITSLCTNHFPTLETKVDELAERISRLEAKKP